MSVGVEQARISTCIEQKFTNMGCVPLRREHEGRFSPAITGIKVIASLNMDLNRLLDPSHDSRSEYLAQGWCALRDHTYQIRPIRWSARIMIIEFRGGFPAPLGSKRWPWPDNILLAAVILGSIGFYLCKFYVQSSSC